MATEEDLRDPVNALLRTQLRVLREQLVGPMQAAVVRAAVGEVMRLQAVSLAEPAAAADFLVRQCPADTPPARLDVLRATAIELFDHHRSRIPAIRARELERSGFVARQARQRTRPEAGCPRSASDALLASPPQSGARTA